MFNAVPWHITNTLCLSARPNGGKYGVCLSRGQREVATAVVEVRWSRDSVPIFDPAIAVTTCEDGAALEWLAAPEHEYEIGAALRRSAA